MYFNFMLNLYMTLSSADNLFKTIWNKIKPDILSGLKMSGLSEVQTVRHFSDITSLNFASMMHQFASISTEGSLLRCNMIWFVVISAAEMGHDTYLPTYLPTRSPTNPPTHLHTYLPTYLPIYLPSYDRVF